MMGIYRGAAADEAGLGSDKSEMILIANASRLGMDKFALIDRFSGKASGGGNQRGQLLIIISSTLVDVGALAFVCSFGSACVCRRRLSS